jgi:hypothetical protein
MERFLFCLYSELRFLYSEYKKLLLKLYGPKGIKPNRIHSVHLVGIFIVRFPMVLLQNNQHTGQFYDTGKFDLPCWK